MQEQNKNTLYFYTEDADLKDRSDRIVAVCSDLRDRLDKINALIKEIKEDFLA